MPKTTQSGAHAPATPSARQHLTAVLVGVCAVALVACIGDDAARSPSASPCEQALQRSAELTVQRASEKRGEFPDAEKHIRQIARASAPSFLPRCNAMSSLAKDTYVACVLAADTATQASSCERKRSQGTPQLQGQTR